MFFVIIFLGIGLVIGAFHKEPDHMSPEEEACYIFILVMIIMAWPLWLLYKLGFRYMEKHRS